MIQKIRCQCAINAQIIILIYAVITVHRVSIRTYSPLFHSVCISSRWDDVTFFICIFNYFIYFFFAKIEILPLVEFSCEEGIPEQEVERLLLAPPKSNVETLDPFVDTMVNEEVSDILPLMLDRDALRALDPTTILIAKWPPPLKTRYYRNLLPEWQISMCPECLQVFHSEDFELQVLQKGQCPFCRTSSESLLN